MQPERFIDSRQPAWQQLDSLVKRSQSGMRRLSPDQVEQLGVLYRAAASDLAMAQRDFPAHPVTRYLNRLVGQAHAAIYQSEPIIWRRLWHYFWRGFPRAVRREGAYIVAAALLFCLPALITGVLAWREPEAARWILPLDAQRLIPLIENKELWVDIPVAERPFVSSFIMTNNIQVAMTALAGGLLAGLLTVVIMINNGLLLGGLMGLTYHYGVGAEFSNFVVGHGVIELSVIFIAGGAGLVIGWAMINPGLLSRRDAVQLAVRRALRILFGCIPILIIAGLIEAFISPHEALPPAVKWGVGWGAGAVMYLYLLLGGRSKQRSPVTTARAPSIPDND